MSRISWISVVTWLAPVVCLLIAFGMGYARWAQLTESRRTKEHLQIEIGQLTTQLNTQQGPARTDRLAAADEPTEPSKFLFELQSLLLASNVKALSIAPTEAVVTPTIQMETGAAPSAVPGAAPSVANKEAPLPMGARALSTQVLIRGSYWAIRQFLYRLRGYRFQVRAININTAVFNNVDAVHGTMDGRLILTRFVIPRDQGAQSASGADHTLQAGGASMNEGFQESAPAPARP